ncbi:MAG: KpsF/GutQ family sugar-phosphate isomerase [Planctomycetota bacterium]
MTEQKTRQRDASPGSAADEQAFVTEVLQAEIDAVSLIKRTIAETHGDAWSRAISLLEACSGHVVVAGMGKSGLIGQKIAATMASLGQPAHFVHPAEAVHGDLGKVRRGDVVMLLSYSGATEEVVNLAAILRSDGVATLGISRNDDTKLAELCDVHIPVGDITEACPLNLAPTASTTAQLVIGDALALAVSRRRSFSADDFHRHHPGGMLGVGLRKITEILRFRVGDNLPVVADSVTLREALHQARPHDNKSRRAGAIVLVDDHGRLSGIFTDGDLRRRIVEGGPAFELDVPVREVMTVRPQHLTGDDLVRDAVRLVRERRVDEIPVLDVDGRPIGLVDVQDLIAMKVVTE